MRFSNKKGIILGVANEKSIAYAITERLKNEGAEICLTFPNEAIERRVRPIAESLNIKFVEKCDVANEEEIKKLRDVAHGRFGNVDFIVHSIAYAEREDLSKRFIETKKEGFFTALDVSAYSLLAICREFEDILSSNASVITLTYLGSTRVVHNYNVMGVAKAALEAIVRYLAYDLGANGKRINAISAGPIKTLAASGISGLNEMLKNFEEKSLLKRRVTQEEVAALAAFLLADESSGITGETIFVDCGYNLVGF